MNFWNRINTRWTREELTPWSSFYKTLYLLFPVILYGIVGDTSEIALWALLNEILRVTGGSIKSFFEANQDTVRGVIYCIGLLLCMLILKRSIKSEILYESEKEPIKELTVINACLLILISLFASVGLNLLLNITGINRLSPTYDAVNKAQFGVSFYAGLIIYGMISPFAEEVIFRGILYNRMKRVFPLWMAIFVSSLLFGIIHGNLVQGIYGTVMGLLMAWAYEHFRNFAAPLIVHCVANVTIFVLGNTLWR